MTSKRARHVSSKGAVWHMSSEQATLAKMPKYNGYACGYGAHGNAKYPSCKIETCLESADAKRRSLSGLLPFVGYVLWGGAALIVTLPYIDILD